MGSIASNPKQFGDESGRKPAYLADEHEKQLGSSPTGQMVNCSNFGIQSNYLDGLDKSQRQWELSLGWESTSRSRMRMLRIASATRRLFPEIKEPNDDEKAF